MDKILRVGLSGDLEHLRLINWLGVEVRLPFFGSVAVTGGAVGQLRLSDVRLAGLSPGDRCNLLRHCRHLLQPGGTLVVPVATSDADQAADPLAWGAWLCGFEKELHTGPDGIVLTKPARPAPDRPLVSILIPAYKAEHLAESLGSALAQTWAECEIIVCDDSCADEVPDVVAAVLRQPGHAVDPQRVRLIRNPARRGGQGNYLQCLAAASGQYIKFLNDDDVLASRCVELMATCLRENPAVTLVTSARDLIDGNGRRLDAEACNEPLARGDVVFEGRHLATRLLTERVNRIGEPSTAMFRREDLADNRPHLFGYDGTAARRNGDTFVWTALLSRGDAIVLREPLSRFRQHANQVQRDPDFVADAHAVWFELEAAGRDTGLVHESFVGQPTPCAPSPERMGPDDFGTAATSGAVMAFLAAEDLTAAVEWLRSRLQKEPGHVRLRSDLGGVLWAAGRRELGLAETLLSLHPAADESAAHNLCQMLRSAGRAAQAEPVERWLAATVTAPA